MKKRTIFILILILVLIAIILLSIIFISTKDKDNLTGREIKEAEQETEENVDETGNLGGGGAGSSSSGASGSGITGDVSEGEIQLPSDLYDAECGFYFSEFGICAGTCPSGKCTEEGRSCYCKKA